MAAGNLVGIVLEAVVEVESGVEAVSEKTDSDDDDYCSDHRISAFWREDAEVKNGDYGVLDLVPVVDEDEHDVAVVLLVVENTVAEVAQVGIPAVP